MHQIFIPGCLVGSTIYRMPKLLVRNHDAERFGAILERLRTERGWTLVKCAQRMGMNATHLRVLEKGGNMPSLETLFEMADVFNIAASEIVREMEQGRKRSG